MNPTACELYRLLAEQASLFSREEARIAHELDLSAAEVQCLCAMREASQYSIKDLSQTLHKAGSQLSRILDSLEDKGLVTRSLSRRDRRSVLVVLTADGIAMSGRIEQWGERIVDKAIGAVPPEKVDDVMRFIRLLIGINEQKDPVQNGSRSK
ncbi:MAG: MarR family winged helix-turn-helix transcriptional regulator [Bacteroidetes bacterium]|nr:MarR family winged helix-turn-helix transcriptional regulator [Bacteroidota bacterium]